MLLAVDSAPVDQPSHEFAHVGNGWKAEAGFATAGGLACRESPTAVSRLLNGPHTFTHHLYHHYDAEPSLPQRHHHATIHGIFCCQLFVF